MVHMLTTEGGIQEIWDAIVRDYISDLGMFHGLKVECVVFGESEFGLLFSGNFNFVPENHREDLRELFRKRIEKATVHRHMLRDPDFPKLTFFYSDKDRIEHVKLHGSFRKNVQKLKRNVPNENLRRVEDTVESVSAEASEPTVVIHGVEVSDVSIQEALQKRRDDDLSKELTIEKITKSKKHSHYFKDVSRFDTIDIYRVLRLFDVTDPCLQHAAKKLLVAGGRGGGKDITRDVKEAIDTLNRFLEMRTEEQEV